MAKYKGNMYKVGQVINLDIPFYKTKERIGEKYQHIIKITKWNTSTNPKVSPQYLSLANGDTVNGMCVKPLSKEEMGFKNAKR